MPPAALPSFPFLSPAEFKAACHSLETRYRHFTDVVARSGAAGSEHGRDRETAASLGGIYDLRVDERDGQTVLVILKSVEIKDPIPTGREIAQQEDEQDEVEDDDPESLVRQLPDTACNKLNVEYNIILSPTYQVPVLYFSLRNSTGARAQLGLDEIYHYLVPVQFKSGLSDVGVMGGISLGDHPIWNVPTYFIHPCNTANALRDVAGDQQSPTTDTYLLLWLGLVGNCVSLQVPSALLVETGFS